jgi:hypothetical protein
MEEKIMFYISENEKRILDDFLKANMLDLYMHEKIAPKDQDGFLLSFMESKAYNLFKVNWTMRELGKSIEAALANVFRTVGGFFR